MPQPYKYFAFISYSRKDSRAAAWLQKRLEWFRFPVKLVPEDQRPPDPRYVRPIYRDKTNLEVTDEHYWKNLRLALEQSRFLIVLASPHSAKSKPVELEVSHFLTSHNQQSRLVVPVILTGRVNSLDDDAALCPTLRNLGDSITSRNLPTMMPDADVAEQDAWEQGFAALISYLLRLDRQAVGDHIQTETRKQARVLRRWLTLVGCLGLLASAAAVLAYRYGIAEKVARQAETAALILKQQEYDRAESERRKAIAAALEASRQRDRAIATRKQGERLLSYLLVDLRNNLKSEAGVAVLRDLDRLVEDYHKKLGVDENDAEQLAAKAWALDLQGETKEALGEMTPALEKYEEALTVTRRMLALDPGNNNWKAGVSKSLCQIGHAKRLLDQPQDAADAFRESIKIQESLTALNHDSTTNLSNLAEAEQELGKILESKGDLSAAASSFEKALSLLKRAVDSNPSEGLFQRNLSAVYNCIGDLNVRRGDRKSALQNYELSLSIMQKLAARDPTNTAWQNDLQMAFSRVGDVKVAQRSASFGTRYLQQAVDARETLAAADPDNVMMQRDLAVTYGQLGEAYLEEGNIDQASRYVQLCFNVAQKLAQKDPSNPMWKSDLGVALNRLGEVQVAQKDLAGAIMSYRSALGIIDSVIEQQPSDTMALQDACVINRHIGEIEESQGHLEAAEMSFSNGALLRSKIAALDPDNAAWQQNLALAYNRLGVIQSQRGNFGDALSTLSKALTIGGALDSTGKWPTDLRHQVQTIKENVESVRNKMGKKR